MVRSVDGMKSCDLSSHARFAEQSLHVYACHMSKEEQRTAVYLDREEFSRIEYLAQSQGRLSSDLIREAVSEYVARHRSASAPLSLGVGSSGAGDLSERAEDLLRGFGEDS